MQLKYKFAVVIFYHPQLFISFILYWVWWVICFDVVTDLDTMEIPHSHRSQLSRCLPTGTSCSTCCYKRQDVCSRYTVGKQFLNGDLTKHLHTSSRWRRKQTTHNDITQLASLTYLERSLQIVSDTEYQKLFFWELSGMIHLIQIICSYPFTANIYTHTHIWYK